MAAANFRQLRADWQPRPETQQLIDARHHQEDRKLMDRYRARP